MLLYLPFHPNAFQNNILSLAIRSEYKEGAKSQKAMIKTFNYNITEGREETIDELLALKKTFLF